MFAAAMSSIDSGVNSITAVVMTDGLDRFGLSPKTEKGHVRAARWLAFGIGAIVVLTSTVMGEIPGNITAVTNKTTNLLATPIFGLFFFALFVPFASPKGVWIGAIFGTLTAILIAFCGPLVLTLHTLFEVDPETFGTILVQTPDAETGQMIPSCPDPISFQWIAPAAITVDIVTGVVGSFLFPRRKSEATGQ